LPKHSPSNLEDSLEEALQRTRLFWGDPDEAPRMIPPNESPILRRLKGPKDFPRLHQKTLYGHLELSTVMDALNGNWEPYQSEVRAVVDSLIAGNPRRAVKIFNQHFGDETTHLRLRCVKLSKKYLITDNVPAQRVSTALGKLLLSSDPMRIKKCHECSKYFFDRTRPGNQRYCMPTCQSRATSRTHRRKKGT
jgi:CGNR zinc finger